MGNIAKVALPIAGGAVGGPAGAAAGSAASSAIGSGGAMGNLTRDLLTGRDGFKSMGLDREKVNRVQELQTQRMFQSMAGTGESMLEPSVFYSNSVQFPYSLYDLWLRSSILPHYEARIHISKTLYNN